MRTRASCVVVLGALICGNARADCVEQTSVTPASQRSPITAELAHEASRGRTWRYAWTAINGGLTVLPIGGLFVLPRRDRDDLILSAVTSAISTGFTWFWPLDVEEDSERALRLHATEPGACDAELRSLFEHSREDEESRYAWPWHVGNFVTALIPAAIILFAFHDRTNAALAVAGGFVLGEAELLTQPLGLVDQRVPGGVFASGRAGVSWSLTYRAAW